MLVAAYLCRLVVYTRPSSYSSVVCGSCSSVVHVLQWLNDSCSSVVHAVQ